MTTAKNIKDTYNLRYKPSIISRLDLAVKNAERCIKPHIVMLGDNGKYWVVCPSDAERLRKNGYEDAQ